MITVRDVTKHFGTFAALDGISLEVPDGSLTALLGPSGSGKSTLLRVIAGLEGPDSGTVEINGQDATGVPPQRRGIGFVFQHYAAFKHMTVRDNVAFGLTVRKLPKAQVKDKVDELLGIVGLAGYQDRYPNQLSGGQRQRMALARALAVEPQRAAAGRALRRAGREGPHGAPRVAARPPRARPGHDDPRDARPGGGHVGRRPHRRHERGAHRAGGPSARALRRAGEPVRHGLPRSR